MTPTSGLGPFWRLLLAAALIAFVVDVWPARAEPALATATAPTSVGVALREFRITAYRASVPPGVVRFSVRNLGEDAHDLELRSSAGEPLAGVPELRAGARDTLSVRLAAGRYLLVCTVGDHLDRGMARELVVRRPRRG